MVQYTSSASYPQAEAVANRLPASLTAGYTPDFKPPNRAAKRDHGESIVIWKLTRGGWQLHRDNWNSDVPGTTH